MSINCFSLFPQTHQKLQNQDILDKIEHQIKNLLFNLSNLDLQ